MASNSVASQFSAYDQDLAIFLKDILNTSQLLKERIALLSAKYPITAREKSLNEVIDKLQQDIRNRLDLIQPISSPSIASEPSEESIPSPTEEVPFYIELYDDSLIRRRTINYLGTLSQSLPRRKKVKELVSVDILTNEKYDPEKRAMTWMQSKEYSSLTTASLTESERYSHHGKTSDSTLTADVKSLVIDIGKLNFKTKSVPYVLFDRQKCDSNPGVLSLASSEHAQKTYDRHDALETAIKIARANYEYWSTMYYQGQGNKQKDPMVQTLLKEYLRCYVKDPIHSKGIIYFYQVQKTLHDHQLQNQVYIGKSEGNFEEKLRALHQSDKDTMTLVKLALQSQALNLESGKGSEAKNVVIILDFGYTEEFFEKYKDRLDKGDKLTTLEKNYIEYFAARSPIGLN